MALEFDITSQNAILYNLNDNTILYEKNKDEKISIASLTKIMTAIVAIEKIDNIKFRKSSDRIKYNYKISEYYDMLSDDFSDSLSYPYLIPTFKNRSSSVLNCLNYIDLDYYRLQAVKDVKRVNLCRDLFCQNCQYGLSMDRQAKYLPYIKELPIRYIKII